MADAGRTGHTRRRGAPVALGGVVAIAALAGVALGLVGARQLSTSDVAAAEADASSLPVASVTAEAQPAPVLSPSPPAPAPAGPVRFTLVAAGDVLPHSPVNASAAVDGGYDFTALMAGVQPYIEGADLALCHMEVPVAPAGTKPTGYPVFSAPDALVRDLKAVGWDGCSTASNHSVDKGLSGVEATLAAFDANRLQHAGTARSADEGARTSFYSVRTGTRTVKVAHISFAYGTNGLPVREPWEVNLFDADGADAGPIIAAAEKARADGADVVVASVHCCVEYRTAPTDAQRSIAEQIAESGAVDLYIGHHAHVPQPIELLPGGPDGDGMWTAFGLGNFLSNQDSNCCVPQTSNGLLLTATFEVDPDGGVAVGAQWTAITVDKRDGHTMHALADITDGAGTLSASQVADRLALVREAAGTQAPERTEPAERLADQMYAQLRISAA
ncbi:CapA family protein [Demequina sp.]|uniref:CapA family protein n=1 Tax=Demequina sp. TaxID=2050685 RepID=UPI0025EA3220|nr:CapA family protein [Demequina sp.]